MEPLVYDPPAHMTLAVYVRKVVDAVRDEGARPEAEDRSGWNDMTCGATVKVDFDIGIIPDDDGNLVVWETSSNRIKFSVNVAAISVKKES